MLLVFLALLLNIVVKFRMIFNKFIFYCLRIEKKGAAQIIKL